MGIWELGIEGLRGVCRDASTIPINIKDRLLTRLATVLGSVFKVVRSLDYWV